MNLLTALSFCSLLSKARDFPILWNSLLGPLLTLFSLLGQSYLLPIAPIITQGPTTSCFYLQSWLLEKDRGKCLVCISTLICQRLTDSTYPKQSSSFGFPMLSKPTLSSPLLIPIGDPRLGVILDSSSIPQTRSYSWFLLDFLQPVDSAKNSYGCCLLNLSQSIHCISLQQPTVPATIISQEEYSKSHLNGLAAPIISFSQFILCKIAGEFILENKICPFSLLNTFQGFSIPSWIEKTQSIIWNMSFEVLHDQAASYLSCLGLLFSLYSNIIAL